MNCLEDIKMGDKNKKEKKDNSAKISQLNGEITALEAKKKRLEEAYGKVYTVYTDYSTVADNEYGLTSYALYNDPWGGNQKDFYDENIYSYFKNTVIKLYQDIIDKYFEIESKIGDLAGDISDKQKEIKNLED